MKKILIFLILLIPINVYGISAKSYIVMDGYSNRIITGDDYNTKRLIASTTKIMTAILAIENGDLEKEVEVSKEVLKAYGSNIYIEVGEKIKLIDLVYGLMLRSGNDAAIMIACNISGSMNEFVKLMNNKAKEIGMNNTLFINSSGLEDNNKNGNTSTAYDMAILMSYAMKNDIFAKITGTKRYIAKSNLKTYDWYNKNKLLNTYQYTVGGKTGFTKLARRTLVTAAKKDDKLFIVVTLNDPDDFLDHKELYENYFPKYNLVKVLDKDKFKIDNTIYDKLYIKDDFKIALTPMEEDNINITYELKELSDYNDNDVVGYVSITLNNKEIAKKDIYALKNESSKSKDSWFKKIIKFLKFW